MTEKLEKLKIRNETITEDSTRKTENTDGIDLFIFSYKSINRHQSNSRVRKRGKRKEKYSQKKRELAEVTLS